MKKMLVFACIFSLFLLILSGCSSSDGGTASGVSRPINSQVLVVNTSTTNTSNDTLVNTSLDQSTPLVNETSASVSVKTFVLTGINFKFLMNDTESPTITVQEGDTVRIEFTSTQGFHDFVVKEFNASTTKVSDGGSTFVEFVADKKGTFEYYCSVGAHRANGMKGNVIVE